MLLECSPKLFWTLSTVLYRGLYISRALSSTYFTIDVWNDDHFYEGDYEDGPANWVVVEKLKYVHSSLGKGGHF